MILNIVYTKVNMSDQLERIKKLSHKIDANCPIIHLTHHKAGTVWFGSIFNNIDKELGIKFDWTDRHKKIDSKRELWVSPHSKTDLSKIKKYFASHMIRDPRDIIVSGYFYHLWCDEEWISRKYFKMKDNEYNFIHSSRESDEIMLKKLPQKGDYSYQEILNSLQKDEGLLFEMKNLAYFTIRDIASWDYSKKGVLELKYEDLILDNKRFVEVFEHYGFSDEEIKVAMKIVQKKSFQSVTKRKLGDEVQKKHLRKGMPGDWKNHFKDVHKKLFKEQWGDLLVRLKYEGSNDW